MSTNPISPHTRLYWLDTIRVLACFLVCLRHSLIPPPNGQGSLWLSAYNYLSAPCIGLFFMVSGALLFPVKLDIRTFISKRLLRIGIPLLFWSAIWVIIFCLTGKIEFNEAIRAFLLFPFKAVTGVYWFMYTIFGLYLFAPIISPAISNEKVARYFLILWGVTLTLPYINAWLPNYWNLTGDVTHPLFEFSGYLGYMVLGYYLRYHLPSWKNFIFKICIPGCFLAIIIPLYFLSERHTNITNDMLYGFLTINIAGLCIIYFIGLALLSRLIPIEGKSIKVLQDFSVKSFGIYLIHILVLHEFSWHVWKFFFPNTGYLIQIPAVAIVTFILSYIIIKLISFIPGSKYIF